MSRSNYHAKMQAGATLFASRALSRAIGFEMLMRQHVNLSSELIKLQSKWDAGYAAGTNTREFMNALADVERKFLRSVVNIQRRGGQAEIGRFIVLSEESVEKILKGDDL